MINTIMFDLDGTLLPMDTELFTKKYFKELSIKLKDYFTPEEVFKHMWSSTKYMMKNMELDKTNRDSFFEDFYKNVDHKAEVLNPIFDEFYERDFNKIKDVSEKNDNMIKSVNILKEKGYDLVVATNPLFPISAVLNRIDWAGLNGEDFIFITNFEDMHFCKPNLDFYREILHNIDKNPENCLMVGNDVKEDMIVNEIGVSTYLIDDYIIGDIQEDKNIDYKGNYKDFYRFAKELPSIKD
ncbi:HAD family hydrolase [Tissierella creatinophila]|uniref:Phosphoglycolate phosphatase n=1 Tax=Tissierella creatinophila DSM 6911 TaxID=1123403 RepID=A0A1U7M513_TISCR|nr:HAD family hydrolase [Tissierella creatinophila]OLS02381.1 phosphoglycolate phosphatase [Tissierella creatinophila DSM 6911]